MDQDLIPIVQKTYDLAVMLYAHVDRFPRAYKPLLGRELMGLTLRLLVCGAPVGGLERYQRLLGSGGRTMRVEE